MPKYKLAEYRYGREEMLALYIKDNKVSRRITASRPKTIRRSILLWLPFAYLQISPALKVEEHLFSEVKV